MRAVDRVAAEEVGFEVLQMMENAGRILAWHARDVRDGHESVAIAGGNGGNGGGGLACARHLANRGVGVEVVLDRPPAKLTGVAAHQHRTIDEMGVPVTTDIEHLTASDGLVVIDALIGYGLRGDVRSPTSEYIDSMNRRSGPIVSLDLPSGVDATSGDVLGTAVTPDRTVTLALPKTGLDSIAGRLFLADIGIPKIVYERLDIEYVNPFEDRDWVELDR
jgi:NAD(P)H-hydrate epimerase